MSSLTANLTENTVLDANLTSNTVLTADVGDDTNAAPAIIADGNTVGWYVSSVLSTITKDGVNRVSQWNDFLGSGHDLLQATGADQPLWSTDGILFDGISEFMQTAPFIWNQPEKIYFVFRAITWTIADKLFDGNGPNVCELYQNAVTPELKIRAGVSSNPDSNLALGTFGIARILFNGIVSTFQINEFAKWTGNAGLFNAGGFTLGTRGGGVPIQFGNFEVKEIILRNIDDTPTNETNIYNYLANKYSI